MARIRFSMPMFAVAMSACLAVASFFAAGPVRANAPEMPDIEIPGGDTGKFKLGGQVYAANCAACHDNPGNRMPQKVVLRNMRPSMILRALESGAMQAQGAALSREERVAVSEYLAGRKLSAEASTPPLNMCDAEHAAFDRNDPPAHEAWGFDASGSHVASSEQAGINRKNVHSLKLKWAFGYPDSIMIRSQPSLAGGAVFTGSQNGVVYALDRETGCVRWTFQAPAEVRTAILFDPWEAGDQSADPLAYFGDLAGNVFAVKAFTGEQVWMKRMDEHPAAVITATPALHGDTLIVPISSLEEASAAAPGYQCCSFRGSVVSVDAATGEEKWRTFLVPEAEANDEGGLGPSGNAVWNTPIIDADRRRIYFATGDNYSAPVTNLSDAIVALDFDTGAFVWQYQATEGDAWNVSCFTRSGNCPEDEGPDFDFGAGTILIADSTGRDLVLAAQKSGITYALDAESGELVWETRVGRGGLAGGTAFGIAATDERVFVPITDFGPSEAATYPASPGIHALDLDSGKVIWRAPAVDICEGRGSCVPGSTGAISATPELVFGSTDDGFLRIYDAKTGGIVWLMDMMRDFDTVNGVPARGGSIGGGAAPVAHDGKLYVSSGYGFASKMPGNVLLVFETE